VLCLTLVARAGSAICAIAFVVSCNGITDPVAQPAFLTGAAAGLEFTTTISNSVIALGDTAIITHRLHNPQTRAVTLSFKVGCSVLPYVSAGNKQVVYPAGGGWVCTPLATSLTIPAWGEVVLKVPVRGGAPKQPFYYYAALGPGRFIAYAELAEQQGRSNSVEFSVVK
jgi:hypothetical protein